MLRAVHAIRIFVALVAMAVLCSASYIFVIADEDVLTSDMINVIGYQIKTDVEDEGISFRTVCEAPGIGETIKVDGIDYTVENVGVIYAKDPNTSGSHNDNLLDKSYTLLYPTPFRQDGYEDNLGYKYVGRQGYDGVMLTFGYVAADNGVIETYDDGTVHYVRTLTGMGNYVTNSLWTRAFVEAVDPAGEEVLIYDEYTTKTSVASIAYQVYTGGTAPTKAGHEYLYDEILHVLPADSPYRMDTKVEYGWGGVVPVQSRD